MKTKKAIITGFIAALILIALVFPSYSAPKEDNGNGKDQAQEIKEPPGQAKQEEPAPAPEPTPSPAPEPIIIPEPELKPEPPGQAKKDESPVPEPPGQSKKEEPKPEPFGQIKEEVIINNQSEIKTNNKNLLKEQNIHKEDTESLTRNIVPEQEKIEIKETKRQEQQQRIMEQRVEHENQAILNNLDNALQKLEQSRWAYNPNDTRGQGNMGKPDMLAPFGHDKDSDRKELYGNNGRVIKEIEPTPEPPPEEPPAEPPQEPPPEPQPEPDPDPQPDPTPEPDPDPQPDPGPILPPPPPDPGTDPNPEPEPDPGPILPPPPPPG